MLIWDEPRLIGQWVESQGGGAYVEGAAAIGYVEGGELIGALTFFNTNGANCTISIALSKNRFPRKLLHAALFYVFKQLTLRRVTFLISSSNIRSQNLVVRLGAKREATLRDADYPSGDVFIYALFPEDCAIWSRINGKIARRPAEPRPESYDPPSRARESTDVRLPASGDADQYQWPLWFTDVESNTYV